MSATPEQIVDGRRIVVCVGSGGVGKTTISASLALGAARRGRRVLVLTIDPAKRLADALGVRSLGNTPRAIPRKVLDGLGVPAEGRLSAMMLDMKRTFDDLVERFAEDAAVRDRILENPIYQHASDALAGSAEYSAMEKVFELSERKDFDLIVLDTPPSQHALDFLEAPQRLLEFLDSRLVQLLLHPAFAAGRFGFRLFQRSAHQVLKALERVSGISFLEDISEFLLAFEGMSEGFRERARQVQALLFGPETAFVLAAGPADESVAHATAFLDRLEESGAAVAGVVLNRLRMWPTAEVELPRGSQRKAAIAGLAEALEEAQEMRGSASRAAQAALAVLDGYAAMVEQDRVATSQLQQRARRNGYFWRPVPELPRDVHDLDGLARIASFVFETGGEEKAVGG
jgi:anion-transporting  ArsA/GET3 family ATPase